MLKISHTIRIYRRTRIGNLTLDVPQADIEAFILPTDDSRIPSVLAGAKVITENMRRVDRTDFKMTTENPQRSDDNNEVD